jgi:hypothetical protein
MPLRFLKKINPNSDPYSTAGRTSQPDVTLISGTPAPSLDQALNSTAPLFFGSRLLIHIGETKTPVTPATYTYGRRRSRSRQRRMKRPTDIEMIAFSPASDSQNKGEQSFAFELLSTSIVPKEFPAEVPRRESVYAKRNE